ncbi:MFS transporter [Alicyclobacillus acidocaldarius]|uniref:Major facilitator superfamily MFS_1 n=1 Tax=Alicyclobacillus acidocaldarius (strain Tc-4-1) TaxID=1048834 RepID=F8IEJ5_ALIAT|nr:MFS transporter [Alicyclobacillus acidocaldarius]AEJ42709.1 major facilitator superfamily MFS_1 [Alicyclobacillus acidocaldarius subsp. acidocaldarius Tc-4-1]
MLNLDRRLVRERNLWILVLGSLFSVGGDNAYFTILSWYTLTVTGSQLALGATMTLASVPRVIFMLVGGAIADRVSRKWIMGISLAARAAVLTAFALRIALFGPRAPLWAIDLMAVLFGVIDSFYYPATSSIVQTAVEEEHVAQASSIVQTVQQASTVMGPILAAVLLAQRDYGLMFVVVAFVFAVAAVTVFWLRLRAHSGLAEPVQGVSAVLRDIADGLRFVVQIRLLLIVMCLSLVVNLFCIGPLSIGVPVMIRGRGWTGAVLGEYQSALGIGSIVGGVIVALLKGFQGKLIWIGMCGALMGLAMATVGYWQVPIKGMAALGLVGILMSIVNIPFLAFLQSSIPEEKLGRVMSVLMLVSVGFTPISYAMSSWILQQGVAPEFLLLACGVGVAGAFAALYATSDYRHIESHPLLTKQALSGMRKTGKMKQP